MSHESRKGKALIEATRPFTGETPARSWAAVLSTAAILLGGIALLIQPFFWPLRLAMAVALGPIVVRMFVLYHDHLHGSLLGSSLLARGFFWLFGVWVMAPPRVWRETHNYHHAHTAQLVGSHIGSFPTQTVKWWREATPAERRVYAFVRHPLTVLGAYFTAFMLEMCLLSFLRSPRKRWDSALSLALTLGLFAVVSWQLGLAAWFYALFVPQFVAHALGAYLFYAQHNFPAMDIQPRQAWTYDGAALESSSYMEGGPLFHWFTANIGFHHVHHLNPSIPFYRLREAMDALPELQHPGRVRLRPASVAACFKLKLWDSDSKRMVGFPT